MNFPRRRFLEALGAATPALALRPAGAFAQTARTTPVSVIINGAVDLLPFHYAYRQGMFTRAGLDVTFTVATSGALSMVAVLGNSAQIGFGGLLSILTAYSKGIPIQLIAPAGEYLSTAPQTEMFVRADSPIRTAKDVEGRTVAVTGLHDQLSIGVRAWVDAAGADSSLIKFVEIPPNSMLAALDAKRVEAIVLFEPLRSEALATGARSLSKPFDAISRKFLSGAYFTTRTYLAENRSVVVRFADVMRQSSEYANAHYDELIPVINSFTKISPEVIQRSNRVHFAAGLIPGDIQPLIDVAVKYKEMPASFPAQDAIFSGR